MKVLIVGNGGREYSIGLNIKKDSRVTKLYFAPGNAGSKNLGENIEIAKNQDLVRFCLDSKIDLVIVGPEVPLVNGLVDELENAGINAFGPNKNAARLEGSKAFMKDFLKQNNIPTAKYIKTNDLDSAMEFVYDLFNENPINPVVIKASGLCAGKGVIIAETPEMAHETIKDMLSGESFGEAGKVVVVEEFLDGFELSVFGICDGDDFKLMPACQDHKRIFDNDKGPNTGGMGAYTPAPQCDEALLEKIKNRIFEPTLKGMKNIDSSFKGILFAGIMVVRKNNELEPYLLEFNVRFGDPECEVLMPMLKTPLIDICNAVKEKKIKDLNIEFNSGYCVAVVAASKNYPFGASDAVPINIKPFNENLGEISLAGVSLNENNKLMASGGRVVLAIGKAQTLLEAKANAYKILDSINFDGMVYRKDIADKALNFLNLESK